jgi:hypothetical protein
MMNLKYFLITKHVPGLQVPGVCRGLSRGRGGADGAAAWFLWIVGFAKTQGYWKSDISNGVYRQLVPHANEASHPMPGDAALQE